MEWMAVYMYSISTSTHSNKLSISNLGVVSVVPAPIPPDSNTEVYDKKGVWYSL